MGESYEVTATHLGPDSRHGYSYAGDDIPYNWYADIRPAVGEDQLIVIKDTPLELLGNQGRQECYGIGCADKSVGNRATLYIPEVDLDIIKADGSEVEEESEEQSNVFVALNVDDDNENRKFDKEEGLVRNEDDLLKLRLRQIKPVDLKGQFTLTFDAEKVRLWKTPEKTGEIHSGQTKLTASKEQFVYVEGLGESQNQNDVQIKAVFMPDPASNYVVRGTEASDVVKLGVVGGNLTAYRPQMGAGSYAPFQRTAVLDIDEMNPETGPGIRVNGDDDNENNIIDRIEPGVVAGENDLIELVISRPQIAGIDLVIERSNLFPELWTASDRMAQISFDDTTNLTEPIDFNGSDSTTVWVELAGHGVDTFDLELKVADDGPVLDTITFHRFTSVVIVLGGLNQVPSNPVSPNHGIFDVGTDLYQEGYDVYIFDEEEVAFVLNPGSGAPYDEIESGVNTRFVNSVAIVGYSQGAGSTYNLTSYLNDRSTQGAIGPHNLEFTAYVDGVIDEGPDPEWRLPVGTQWHLNLYQDADALDLPATLLHGTSVAGSNDDWNVEQLPFNLPRIHHLNVDDHVAVKNWVKMRFRQNVSKR